MAYIHPTAHVHPDAYIGEGSTIDPGVVIGPHVYLGANCEVRSCAIITGHTRIGEYTQIGYHAVIGAEPQDLAWQPGAEPSFTEIGSHNIIREHVTIHRGTASGSKTLVGNNCYLMAGCHLAHNVTVGNHVIIANNALCAGHVSVGDRAFISGGVVIHQHVRIGRLAMLQGNSAIGKDVPPFLIAARINRLAGLNTIGLRRAGISSESRLALKRAYHILFRTQDTLPSALDKLKSQNDLISVPEVAELAQYITGSKRGTLNRHLGAEEDD